MADSLSLSTGDPSRDAAEHRLRREQEAAAKKAKKITEEVKTKAEPPSEKPSVSTSNDKKTNSFNFGTANPPPNSPSRAKLLTGANKGQNNLAWTNQNAAVNNSTQDSVHNMMELTESSQNNNLNYLAGTTERLSQYQERKIHLDEKSTEQKALVKDKADRLPEFNTERRSGSLAERKALEEFANANEVLQKVQTIQSHINRELETTLKSLNKEQDTNVLNTTKLAEAKSLINNGDYQGAQKVLNGQSHKTKEDLSIKLDIKTNQADLERSELDPKQRAALEYQEGLTQLSLNGQDEIKGIQAQAAFLRKAALENPRLSPEQKQEFLKQEATLQAQVLERARQLDQIQQLQPHVTDLIDQAKYDEVQKLQKGDLSFPTVAKYNDKELAEKVLAVEPKLTIEQSKKDAERLLDLTSQARATADEFSTRYTQASNDTSSDLSEMNIKSWNYFDRALGTKLDNLADVEGSQGTKLRTVSNSLVEAQSDARKLIQDGKLDEARNLLKTNLKSFTREVTASQNLVSKERTNEKFLAPINQEIDASYKAIRNGIVMTGATIITGGIAGAAIKASSTATLSFAAGTKAFLAGTGYALGATAAGEFAGIMRAGGSPGEALKYSASQIAENAHSAALGSFGALAGATWGPKIAAKLLSPQANESLQLMVRSSVGGLSAASPGVINDIATKSATRVSLISNLQKEGKTAAEIDRALEEQKLDFQSISSLAAISLAAGAASGLLAGIADDAARSITGNVTTSLRAMKSGEGISSSDAFAMKATLRTAEEIVQLGIAAAETSQSYTPGTPEFNNALIANFASLVPSKISGRLGSQIDAQVKKENQIKQDADLKAEELANRPYSDRIDDMLNSEITIASQRQLHDPLNYGIELTADEKKALAANPQGLTVTDQTGMGSDYESGNLGTEVRKLGDIAVIYQDAQGNRSADVYFNSGTVQATRSPGRSPFQDAAYQQGLALTTLPIISTEGADGNQKSLDQYSAERRLQALEVASQAQPGATKNFEELKKQFQANGFLTEQGAIVKPNEILKELTARGLFGPKQSVFYKFDYMHDIHRKPDQAARQTEFGNFGVDMKSLEKLPPRIVPKKQITIESTINPRQEIIDRSISQANYEAASKNGAGFKIQEAADLPKGINGEATVFQFADGRREATVKLAPNIENQAKAGNQEALTTYLHELRHAQTNHLIDATNKSPEAYQTYRAIEELGVRMESHREASLSASGKVPSTEAEAKYISGIAKLAAVKDFGKDNVAAINQALDDVKATGLITDSDLANYSSDYQFNTTNTYGTKRQTSNSSVVETPKTKTPEIKQKIQLSNPNNWIKPPNFDQLKQGTRVTIGANNFYHTGHEYSDPNNANRKIPILVSGQEEVKSFNDKQISDTYNRMRRLTGANGEAVNASGSGLEHGYKRHGSHSTNDASILLKGIGKDNLSYSPSSKFAQELTQDQYTELIKLGLANVESIVVNQRDTMIIGNIPGQEGNLGASKIKIAFTESGELLTAMPTGKGNRPQMILAKVDENGQLIRNNQGQFIQPGVDERFTSRGVGTEGRYRPLLVVEQRRPGQGDRIWGQE